ncbi:MAG: membrane protein insertase YidC [Victivallales bacterium]|nr:membrane protein insertase YidC [Victivallales bacterium]
MKFDKETIIVFCICGIVLLAWNPLCKYMGWVKEAPPATAPAQQTAPTKEIIPTQQIVPAKPTSIVPAKATSSVTKVIAEKVSILPEQKIENEHSSFIFNPNNGILEKIVFLKYFQEDYKTPITLDNNIAPGALAVFADTDWTINEILDNSADSSTKTYRLVRKMTNVAGKTFKLTQQWQIESDYIMNYSVGIKNTGDSELEFSELSIMGISLLPFSILTLDTDINRETNAIDYCMVNGTLGYVATNDDDDDFFAPAKDKIRWCGGNNKYFASLILAEKPFDKLLAKRKEFPKLGKYAKYYLAALGGSYSNISIPSGKEETFSFKCYNGPKIISQLAKFDKKAPEIMNLSWGGPMDWIAEKLLSFLVYLKGLCGSYGWSIIIITVMVRMLFWPVTQKANKSMKKMQKLQPQMKEIRAQYKDDPQTMNAKVMELYRTEKVNPLGGCLPILMQIPVFIALYSTLNGAVELRQVPFWWIQDLAKPDTVATIFGLAINPLIIAMTGLMVLQQRLTPAAMDPAQQKMMMFMPVVMLFMLYSLPAGLTLYWTVSQSLAILQLVLQKRMDTDNNQLVKKAA